ncbi:MAG: sulfite exporter TauE/SafE family protein [Candidatus Competibacter sp.]|nr:sulfite exporter TauE/SafE family protein [Candidatus Competibacter sp.]MDG4584486.1 sulfite exporter TauE/SafE family protein [Candidatus Competibacter sp.]
MSSQLTARAFRRRVLRPAEGVFLFHPRVLRRLIRRHLGDDSPRPAIPLLRYYLMPREILLIGLEDENPDALAVIEGLNLPDWAILLPMPSTQELAADTPEHWLRAYWGRRFAAEVARAWQMARHDNQDQDSFGARAWVRRIGETAFREARSLLEQDQRVVLGLDDETLCRHLVGFVTYLRYFIPGARAYFFPAIRDWGGLDRWLKNSGLDLPPPRHGSRWPHLLTRSRPSGFHGAPDYEPELPLWLPFGRNDPDLTDGANTILPLLAKPAPSLLGNARGGTGPNRASSSCDRIALQVEARCREALRQASTLTRKPSWIVSIWRDLTGRMTPVMEWLALRLNRRSVARGDGASLGWVFDARLRLFHRGVQAAFRAEMAGRYGTALRYLCVAVHQYRELVGIFPLPRSPVPQGKGESDSVARILEERREEIVEALAHGLAATWRLDAQSTRVLEHLMQRLLDEPATARPSSPCSRLLHGLERVFLEGRTDYYRLQPVVWLWSGGRQPLRLGLPFQGSLKALRVLNAAKADLDQSPWSGAEVSYFSAPLRTLGDRIGQRLRQQVLPRLHGLLDTADFLPGDLRQQVARNVLREELFDIVLRRWHLRFTDLRDSVARNELRLPDPNWRELLLGDRLARFDRQASAALPGVYQPGEFYLKGLQQLSAPLFGTSAGRWITRFLLLPFGVAFIGLEALGYLLSLVPAMQGPVRLVGPVSVLGIGMGLIVVIHTERGRAAVSSLGNGFRWLFAKILHRGLARWLRWGRATRWFRYPLVRKGSRYVLEPLLIGLVLALPTIGVAGGFGLGVEGLPAFLLLGFTVGSILRNSQAGRRLLDVAITRFVAFWRRVHRNLLIGLVRWAIDLFGWLMQGIEQALHRVDEAVSHHRDEGRNTMAIKAIVGPPWRALSYLIHFYAAVLIEPQINPIKHFPVVMVADKLMLPFFPVLTATLLALLDPILPRFIGLPLATVTVLLSPGLFGFLAWELKENWKLYRANHPDRIQPAHFGPRRETLHTLLRPGFHSGVLPRAFAELRQAIGQENERERPCSQRLRQAEGPLNEILESLRAFVARELLFTLLERCRAAGYECAEGVVERLEVATAALDVRVALYPFGREDAANEPVVLKLGCDLRGNELQGEIALEGHLECLGAEGEAWLKAEAGYFLGRAACQGYGA